jgi:hypothetical protein
MDIEREMLVEIAVSVGAVATFIIALLIVGSSNGGSGLSSTGAVELIGVVFGFILLMSGVGIFLDRR